VFEQVCVRVRVLCDYDYSVSVRFVTTWVLRVVSAVSGCCVVRGCRWSISPYMWLCVWAAFST